MICTRTLTIDPPGTHSLLGIDILMRCNLDIDRSLCFPAAIQSESATSTYKVKTARVLETGENNLNLLWSLYEHNVNCLKDGQAFYSPRIGKQAATKVVYLLTC